MRFGSTRPNSRRAPARRRRELARATAATFAAAVVLVVYLPAAGQTAANPAPESDPSPLGSAPGAGPAAAESVAETAPSRAFHVEEVVVTGAPLPRTISELAKPVSVLEGKTLLPLEAPQLGEVLAELPGVSQTYFGPGASRPVIRGLGGDNIRVLENGLGLLDASAVSPDHAVSLEPLLTKRIEVVRGPSALLYGPNAIGGVVNNFTSRIPDEPIANGVQGVVQGRGNTVNLEAAGIGILEAGYDGWAVHLDAFGRETDNVSIPGFARSPQLRKERPLEPGESEEKGELINSALSTQGGAAGVSYFFGDDTYAGVSPSIYDTTYGIPGAPSTFIELRQTRLDFAGAIAAPLPSISTVKGRLGLVDYQHKELELTADEGAIVGTRFKNRGYDLRFDALHEQIGPFEGAFGFESYYSDFDAAGAEAFLPPNTTATQSLFGFEEILLEPVRLQFSGRLDFSTIEASAAEAFGPADSRDFVTGGASAGAIVTLSDPYSVAVNLVYAQRPPNAQELFANGPHLATQQFEIGDRNLSAQEAFGVEVVARKSLGRITGSLGGYYNRFNNFIDLLPTGEFFDTSDSDHGHSHGGDPIIPVFAFESVPANFAGMEAEATVHVLDHDPYTFDIGFQADYVAARNRDTDEPLPYLPPFRLGSSVRFAWEAFTSQVSILWARQQKVTPEFILPTDAYVMLDIDLGYTIDIGPTTVDLFARASNLLNQDARVSTSTLKDVAPLPGVGALGGFRMRF